MFPDVAGLRTWGGEDLTVAPDGFLERFTSAVKGGAGIGTMPFSPRVSPPESGAMVANCRHCSQGISHAQKKGQAVYFYPHDEHAGTFKE